MYRVSVFYNSASITLRSSVLPLACGVDVIVALRRCVLFVYVIALSCCTVVAALWLCVRQQLIGVAPAELIFCLNFVAHWACFAHNGSFGPLLISVVVSVVRACQHGVPSGKTSQRGFSALHVLLFSCNMGL